MANESARSGFAAIREILSQQKPEAAYFAPLGGQRTLILILTLSDAAAIGAIAEPWYLAFRAKVEISPAMVREDLEKAGPVVADAVARFLA